ncbi:uncharacterized protein AMSG_05388 [Thecamonas trahens ATCC 50062]|uniref:Uncharacterized protein n=1 Tax=Thecamonas trahens ATCC 50062 TaxID=461836 RepID=A0A0L0DDJ3_THETB|nr:hypothetical protein AMSG_05388 [Thecamonas trahens ATCC 50062]KNC49388.1 hypothetical protein AMSG_05388 [Thecamonas trahens ATCC 50062]|eukprot:XP_013757813.1 hypothetical protein AMSG_05388 [Thecamonas trahens ATCC 50062]
MRGDMEAGGMRSRLDALSSAAHGRPGRGRSAVGGHGPFVSAMGKWLITTLIVRWKLVLGLLVAAYPVYAGARHAVSSGMLDQAVDGRIMVVYARCGLWSEDDCAGMMSEFHAMLGALKYAELHGAAAVRPHLDTPMYLDKGRGNSWWSYFSRPTPSSPPEVHLNSYVRRYGRLGGFGHIVYGSKGYLYPMTHALDRKELSRLMTKYFAFQPALLAKVDTFVDDNFHSDFVLGVHYRGLDTVQHYPYYKIEYGYFWDEMAHVLVSRGLPLPPKVHARSKASAAIEGSGDASAYPYSIFVATDEAEFLEQTRERFAPVPVVASEAPRKSSSDTVPLHKDHSLANYVKGESVLIDARLLAECSYIIKGRSGVSEASLVFNPEVPYSFFISRTEIYRDSMPSSGNPERLEFEPKP